VACVDELHVDAVDHRKRAIETERLELRNRAVRIRLPIERKRRVVLRVAVLVRRARIFFLKPRRVGKDQLRQV